MKKLTVLALFVILPMLSKANNVPCPVDTSDNWRVYYNGVEVNACNGFFDCIINLNEADLKPTDTLSVSYYRDAPCSDCNYFLLVQTDKHYPVSTSTMAPERYMLKLPMVDIIKFTQNTGKTNFSVFYNSNGTQHRGDSTLLFRLKLN